MNQSSENEFQELKENNRRDFLIQSSSITRGLIGFSIGFEDVKIIGC